ncbi:MAG: DUF11 domain-containing protein [Clostridia bacterium]|nr:DUF11 domain-containing protein [Clostridia bacterium]
MKGKKGIALTLALMLCLMMSTALAATLIDGNWTNNPNGTSAVTHEHNWIRPYVVREATCTSTGIRRYTCRGCQQTKDETIPKLSHSWGGWQTTRQATCTSTGQRERRCSVCGEKQTETIAKEDHDWGSWKTLEEATCTHTGLRSRTCRDCGTTERVATEKTEHRWGKWTVTRQATCKETGLREHRCTVCGHKATQTLKKTDHTPGTWEIEKEPTCQHGGTRTTRCLVCGAAIRENLKKVGHRYGEWKITTEATDHSKGKRSSACDFCGRKKTEEFYPEGTLAPDLDNPPGEVAELQRILAVLGNFNGQTDGKYGGKTSSAVKKFQKTAGVKQDGIAWPQTLNLLKGFGKGKPVAEAKDKYTLQIDVALEGEAKDAYRQNDQAVYDILVTNAAKKSTVTDVVLYVYKSIKADSKAELQHVKLGSLGPGESVNVTISYIVTGEDVENTKFVMNFAARGKYKKNARSNSVYFVHSTTKDLPAEPEKEEKETEAEKEDKEKEEKKEEPKPEEKAKEKAPEKAKPGTGSGGWTPPSDYELDITKTVDNEPDNHAFFTAGETVRFTVTVTNNNKVSIKDVIVTDTMAPDLSGSIGTLKAGETATLKVEHEVTGPDAVKGTVTNEAVVSYAGTDGLKTAKASATALTGQGSDALQVNKVAVSMPENGLFYKEGEQVDFTIFVTNPMDKTVTDLRLYEHLFKKTIPYDTLSSLEGGKMATFSFSTKVTPMQVKKTKLTNLVRVTYKDPDEKKRVSVSNLCSVPTGREGEDGVVVNKTVISTPENGKYYQEGEEIRYLIEVVNNTVHDITNLDVLDSLAELDENDRRAVTTGEKLAAGGTFSIHFSYIVSEGDVKNTKVVNKAQAVWTVLRDQTFTTDSEKVTVPTAEVIRKRKPEPVELEEDGICIPTLTAEGEGYEWHEVEECERHAETARSSAGLTASGRYDDAIRLWDADIAALYSGWIGKADAEGTRIAENEQIAFGTQMKALSGSLALVCGETEVKTILTEERMNKCFGLCYELHDAPKDRPDSRSTKHLRLPDTSEGEECEHTVRHTENTAYYVDGLCSVHTEISQAAREITDAATDEESRAVAWQRVQDSWLAELDAMYDAWYLTSKDDAARKAVADDRMSFDDLIEARRESLAELYPDAPATAEEVLADMIMNRTEMICRVLHHAGVLEE